jgi:hypothetical protein
VTPVTQAALVDLAVQRADEVVAVLVRAVPAGLVGTEHLLDVLAVCEYPNTGCQALAGQARVMVPYTLTTTAYPSAATLRKRKLAAALHKCS